ncbi:MAG TPA: monovalent cation/H(+) antiporter subunit G [Sandaracinaceae bacterium LLY-WYZ-13_1]|nr:monovalent cation/H(+) antiporter subunit G [Sandaracinaceae bacterium LLY-WYZ-13_1]
MMGWVIAALVLAGASLMLVASIGIVRLPDTITRLHAATKAGAVGLSLLMVAVSVELSGSAALEALLVSAFVLLTAPVAAHTIARAAYFVGVQLWEGTIRDDLWESGDIERTFQMEEHAFEEEERREQDRERKLDAEREAHTE